MHGVAIVIHIICKQLNLKPEQNMIKMAEKAACPCPCTHPKLLQFKRVSMTTGYHQTAIRGKSLLWLGSSCNAVLDLYVSLSCDSVFKALHINKSILTDKDYAECTSKEWWYWCKLTAISIAIKPPDVVQLCESSQLKPL